MRERYLTGFGEGAAADQRRLADGMMRKPKRSRTDDARARDEQSADAVNLCHFERFVQRHRRKNGRQPSRQHRFPASWRTHEQQIVAAGRGDFERAFGRELTAHVGEIAVDGVVVCFE